MDQTNNQLLNRFRNVSPQMVWAGPAMRQFNEIEAILNSLSVDLSATAEIVGTHCSKSIDLPVVKITTTVGEIILRDNFYDTNLMAILRKPSELSVEQFFAGIQEPLSWEWYLEEIEKARGCTWKHWSEEEMGDPKVLRVLRRTFGGQTFWDETTGDKKDRWTSRLQNPDWFERDWSRGRLTWTGTFGPGVKLFRQDYAFAEGMPALTSNRAYTQGCRDFLIAVESLTVAATLIRRLHRGQEKES